MKNKKKKKLKQIEPPKEHNFFGNIFIVYKMLFYILFPCVVGLLPIVPYIITNNPMWCYGLFISIPLCAVLQNYSCNKLINGKW